MRDNFMNGFRIYLALVCGLLVCIHSALARPVSPLPVTTEELQRKFDAETNAVHKAKLLERLGDLQFEDTRDAGRVNDFSRVGLILEKYRDNARAALELLKKKHPDAEHQSNGYRQLQMHVQRGIREVKQVMAITPDPYKPPLQIVLEELIGLDDELLRLLFPPRAHPEPPVTKPAEKQT
jgi:hypothetical protein